MEKVDIQLKSGKTVKFFDVSSLEVKMKYRRKTRHLNQEQAFEEILWLAIEDHMTDEEIEVIDNLSSDEFQELITEASNLKK